MFEDKTPEIIQDGDKKIYRINFNSTFELERYLRSNPPVNTAVFKSQKSMYLPRDFAGEELETAIGYCIGGYTRGFERFMELKKKLDSVNLKEAHNRKTVSSFVGTRPNIVSYVAGSPKAMLRPERIAEKKFIDLYLNLACSGGTSDDAILNRGILTLNLINVLEGAGMGVNLFVFEASSCADEIFIAEIKLKRTDEITDIGKCFYPMCGKEFLRRVLARVKESMPFEKNWSVGYGARLSQKKTKEILKISEDAYYISTPEEMGIKGNNIFEDADMFISKLNLSDKVTVPRYSDYMEWAK